MTRANLLSFNWVNNLRARKVFASLYGMKQNDKQTKEFQMSDAACCRKNSRAQKSALEMMARGDALIDKAFEMQEAKAKK